MNKPSYLLFKKCTKCGKIKHISKFCKKKTGKYGVRPECKKCQYEYNKQYKENHKEEIYEYNKKWFEDNPKKVREYNKKYKGNHKEEIKERSRNYRKNNPEKIFNQQNRRRLKEENRGRGITKEQWLEMMNFFDWKCAYSGEKMEDNKTTNGRTVDHIIALDNGGENEPWNIIPMKKGYNTSKHTKDMLEWYLEQPFFSIERLTKIYEWRIYAYEKWGNEI